MSIHEVNMEWGQVLAIAAINIGLIAWLRMDMKEMEKTQKGFQESIKDFQGRLYRLEEKYIQVMQKYWEGKK